MRKQSQHCCALPREEMAKIFQTKYGYSLLQLSRVIRETFFDRKSLVDIFTVTPEHMATARNEALQRTLF